MKKSKGMVVILFFVFLFSIPISAEGESSDTGSRKIVPYSALGGISDINQVKDRLIKLDNYFHPVTSGQGVVSNVTNMDGYDIVNVTKRGTTFGNGAIWSEDGFRMDLNYDFSTSMWLYFGKDPESGTKPEEKKVGDGMAFVMHADPEGKNAFAKSSRGNNTFGGGASLGVWAQANTTGGIKGAITNSLAIEFDNHINKTGMDKDTTNSNDGTKPYGHIAWGMPGKEYTYGKNGTSRTQYHNDAQAVDTFGDNRWHQFSIKWDSGQQQLTYKLDNLPEKTISFDTQFIFGTNIVYWGFTGSTGAAKMDARVAFEEFPRPIFTRVDETIVNESGESVLDRTVAEEQKLTYQVTLNDIKGTGILNDVTIMKKIDPNIQFSQETANVRLLKNGQPVEGMIQQQQGWWLFLGKQPVSLIKGDQLSVAFDVKMKPGEKTSGKPLQLQIDSGDTAVIAKNNMGSLLSEMHHAGVFYLDSNLAPELRKLEAVDQIPITEDFTAKVNWEEWNALDEGIVSFTLDDLSTSQTEDMKREQSFNTNNSGSYLGQGTAEANFGKLSAGSYRLTVKARDKNQKLSNELTKNITVRGTLTLVSVPDILDFGEVAINQIENGKKEYERASGNKMTVEVADFRSTSASPWILQATLQQPMTVEGKVQSFSGKLFNSEVGAGGTDNNYPNEQLITIRQNGSLTKTWQENEGILLQVRDTVIKGSYSATINWTLQDGL
ncbi:lectin-like domain-containing protein [Candidatus Enterococcus clewellii]|nr:hypothetical protein [Enterococcus sp. 9E7_DIV0242]